MAKIRRKRNYRRNDDGSISIGGSIYSNQPSSGTSKTSRFIGLSSGQTSNSFYIIKDNEFITLTESRDYQVTIKLKGNEYYFSILMSSNSDSCWASGGTGQLGIGINVTFAANHGTNNERNPVISGRFSNDFGTILGVESTTKEYVLIFDESFDITFD